MTAELYAESWQACQYDKKHPENAHLPTAQQKCLGPWIRIFPDDSPSAGKNDYSAYWSSSKGACHGGETYSVKRNGNVYQGDKMKFQWSENQ